MLSRPPPLSFGWEGDFAPFCGIYGLFGGVRVSGLLFSLSASLSVLVVATFGSRNFVVANSIGVVIVFIVTIPLGLVSSSLFWCNELVRRALDSCSYLLDCPRPIWDPRMIWYARFLLKTQPVLVSWSSWKSRLVFRHGLLGTHDWFGSRDSFYCCDIFLITTPFGLQPPSLFWSVCLRNLLHFEKPMPFFICCNPFLFLAFATYFWFSDGYRT